MKHVQAIVAASTMGLGLLVIALALMKDRQQSSSESITGEVVAFEASRQELTLRTRNGDRHFIVHESTTVHEGAKTIRQVALRSAGGCPAKIWYRDARGGLIAQEIRISCAVVPHGAASSASRDQ